MRLTVFSDGRCTGQCVQSAKTSPPPGPGTIHLNSSLVSHATISFEAFLAVGSTDASIRPITLRYPHTLVWSTPKIACSVPCAGLFFFAHERHEQGVPEAQPASVPGIRRLGFVVAKQRHVAGGRRVRPCLFQNILELFPAAQGRRVQAGLV